MILGVSGGADSICLFYVLKKLSEELPLSLRVAHVNHGIRGEEAEADAAFVRELCLRWEIPFHLLKKNVPELAKSSGLSEEDAGRRVRYGFFRELKEEFGADRIAVAHQKEDAAETVLLHLFRGSGLKGLSGMEPVAGDVIRPLLCVSRAEVLKILEEAGLSYREDSTNDEDFYERNRIRHHILAYAEKEIRPGAAENILRSASLAAEADRYLRRQARALLEEEKREAEGEERREAEGEEKREAEGEERRGPEDGERSGSRTFLLPKKVYEGADPALQGYLIREAFGRMAGCENMEMVHVRDIGDLFEKQPGKSLSLPGNLRAERVYEGVRLLLKETEEEKKAERLSEGTVLELDLSREKGLVTGENGELLCRFRVFPWENGKKIPDCPYTKWLNYDTITRPVVFRRRHPGDYLTIAPSGRKTLKSLLIDEKIPREKREDIWLLAEGSHVLWAVGLRISETGKIQESTRMVLEVEWLGEKEERGKKDE